MSDCHFRFEERSEAACEAYEIAQQMQEVYPRDKVLSGAYLCDQYVPEVIEKFLGQLRFDLFAISIGCETAPNCIDFTETEPRYGTKYCLIPLEPDFRKVFESLLLSYAESHNLDL